MKEQIEETKQKLIFIGEDSLGYEKGKTYELVLNGDRSHLNPKYKDSPVVIERVGGGGLCAYSSWEKFMENWATLEAIAYCEEQTMLEEATGAEALGWNTARQATAEKWKSLEGREA